MSREMLGGPLLGVAVFIVTAVLLGWGLTKLFSFQLAGAVQDPTSVQIDHGFSPDTVYVLKRDLLIGRSIGLGLVLYPSRDDLPHGTPNRRFTPTVAQYHADPGAYPDIVAVVPAGSRVRFPRVTVDTDNRQTSFLLDVELIDSAFADQRVTALHLEEEATTTDGEKRVVPRGDLLEPSPDAPGPSAGPGEPIQ